MPEVKIDSCKLIDLHLVESKYQEVNKINDGEDVEIRFQYKVDFQKPDNSDELKFVLPIEASITSLRGEESVFSAECKYRCIYKVEEESVDDIEDYSQFSESLGKRIYLTVREHLLSLMKQGDAGYFMSMPFDLPSKKKPADEVSDVGE